MAKRWADFTKREKTIGVLVAVFSVFAIGGIASGSSDTQPAATTPESNVQVQTKAADPVITYKEVQETEEVPYAKENRDDNSRNSGTSAVTTTGVNGVKTKTYKVTLTDGKETGKELIKEEVTTQPVTEITSVGTYVAPVQKAIPNNCDPNYSGACVPIASDVDCEGGKGNGPSYVRGPVYVIGTDIYDLDRDGNGIGCES